MRVLLGSLSVTLGSLREGMGGAETEGQGAESALDAWEPLSALLFGCLESGRVVLRCAGLCWAGPGGWISHPVSTRSLARHSII